MNKPLILVVEDDAPVRNLITTTLKLHDYRFLTAANGDTALIAQKQIKPRSQNDQIQAGYPHIKPEVRQLIHISGVN